MLWGGCWWYQQEQQTFLWLALIKCLHFKCKWYISFAVKWWRFRKCGNLLKTTTKINNLVRVPLRRKTSSLDRTNCNSKFSASSRLSNSIHHFCVNEENRKNFKLFKQHCTGALLVAHLVSRRASTQTTTGTSYVAQWYKMKARSIKITFVFM